MSEKDEGFLYAEISVNSSQQRQYSRKEIRKCYFSGLRDTFGVI